MTKAIPMVNKLGVAGAILAFLAAFFREIPVAILPGGTASPSTGSILSLAMFTTGTIEVFPWGTIQNNQAMLLADFTPAGAFGLALWGFLVFAIVLGISGSSPGARPRNAKIQLNVASILTFAEVGTFLFLSIISSLYGAAGVRLGWVFILGSGLLFAFAAPSSAKSEVNS
jgi:hypothetical protein